MSNKIKSLIVAIIKDEQEAYILSSIEALEKQEAVLLYGKKMEQMRDLLRKDNDEKSI